MFPSLQIEEEQGTNYLYYHDGAGDENTINNPSSFNGEKITVTVYDPSNTTNLSVV